MGWGRKQSSRRWSLTYVSVYTGARVTQYFDTESQRTEFRELMGMFGWTEQEFTDPVRNEKLKNRLPSRLRLPHAR